MFNSVQSSFDLSKVESAVQSQITLLPPPPCVCVTDREKEKECKRRARDFCFSETLLKQVDTFGAREGGGVVLSPSNTTLSRQEGETDSKRHKDWQRDGRESTTSPKTLNKSV